MIELSRHIESLLLKHNCVIVPHLGGFVTQYVPARPVKDEGLFLPPCRSIGFNPRLQHNDGLLIQSYMQAYDTSYPETVRLIDEAVRQVREQLLETGEFELSSIGKLILRMDGNYDFEPCEAGVLSPELYGLDAFSISTFAAEEEPASRLLMPETEERETTQRSPKRTYTLSINRELVNYVAASICAIFIYFLWATPLANTGGQNASMVPAVMPQRIVSLPQAKKTQTHPEKPAKEQSRQTEVTTAQRESKQESAVTTEKPQPYTIVLASSISKKGAESFVKELHEEGYGQARACIGTKMIRVVYDSFSSEDEAQASLKELRQKSDVFADAWVLKTEK